MYNKLFFNLARNSLRHLIRTCQIKEINIPYYLCDEIRHSIIKEKCKPVFYHIDDNFLPLKNFNTYDYILYPNYFGVCDKNIQKLCNLYPRLIVDNSHSFYSEPKGFACFNSARKFLPVYNGSVLWLKKYGNINSYKTEEYRESCKNGQEKLKAEINFQKSEPALICKKSIKEIEKFNDLTERKNKFIFFHEKYSSINLLDIDIKNTFSPFCYPLLLKDEITADKFANELIKKGYEILRYWKNMPKTYNEYKFYRNIVPIPLNNFNQH